MSVRGIFFSARTRQGWRGEAIRRFVANAKRMQVRRWRQLEHFRMKNSKDDLGWVVKGMRCSERREFIRASQRSGVLGNRSKGEVRSQR